MTHFRDRAMMDYWRFLTPTTSKIQRKREPFEPTHCYIYFIQRVKWNIGPNICNWCKDRRRWFLRTFLKCEFPKTFKDWSENIMCVKIAGLTERLIHWLNWLLCRGVRKIPFIRGSKPVFDWKSRTMEMTEKIITSYE